MKRLFAFLLTVGLLAAPSLATASQPYISLSTGLGLMLDGDATLGDRTDEEALGYKSGYVVEGALGTKTTNYRGELAVAYQTNELESLAGFDLDELGIDADVDVEILSYMINGYRDFEVDSVFSPYLMAGVGFADIKGKASTISTDDTVFAYQVGLGLTLSAADNIDFDLGYRYFATNDARDIIDGLKLGFSASRIMLGIRCTF